MTSTDKKLLDILEAHGQNFLDSFKPQKAEENRRKRVAAGTLDDHQSPKSVKLEVDWSSSDERSDSAEEWTGFGSDIQMEDEDEFHSSTEEVLLEASASVQKPDVVVFSGFGTMSSEPSSSKVQSKSFMSSKVSKLRDERRDETAMGTSDSVDNEEDELTNAQNDALLHRLVHTQLLSGSLRPELRLTSAQQKKALEGRILELSGSSKIGQGEKMVRAQERDKASKRVREGLLDKQKQRREKLVQEAKDMGNYHPAFKKHFQDPLKKSTKRNRERGLRMGIGSYGGGVLKLDRREIQSVQGGLAGGRLRGRPRHKKS